MCSEDIYDSSVDAGLVPGSGDEDESGFGHL